MSISVDSDNAAWLKAVEEEQMPWLQLHDNEGVMRQYGVEGIPSVFLIDCNDGTVVFEKLYGDAVIGRLEEGTGIECEPENLNLRRKKLFSSQFFFPSKYL